MAGTVHLLPFWSYGKYGYGKQILANVLLFVPVGCFAAEMIPGSSRKRFLAAVAVGFFTSLMIELIQFWSCRGITDIDDLIDNTVGAVIGAWIAVKVKRFRGVWRIGCLLIGVFGCLYASKNDTTPVYERQFAFQIDSADWGEQTRIKGFCSLYTGNAPYNIILRNTETGEMVKTKLSAGEKNEIASMYYGIDNCGFEAAAVLDPEAEYEAEVVWGHHSPVSTGQFIKKNTFQSTEKGILLVYNEKYDLSVYQKDGSLYWFIGRDIPENTWIDCHVHTTQPEKIREDRVAAGLVFDNFGFRESDGIHEITEQTDCGDYRVFRQELPVNYPITTIMTGFNIDGKLEWHQYFRPHLPIIN